MNQKNIFTVIGAVLVLQGIAFFAMGDKMALDTFPYLNADGKYAVTNLLQVLSVVSVLVGLISFAAKNSPQVLWAYTAGFTLFSLISLKHMFRDHINVPVPAIIIQIGIALVCCYLWMQSRKTKA